jgi:DNA polymerase III epsilon subunit family exonuclease
LRVVSRVLPVSSTGRSGILPPALPEGWAERLYLAIDVETTGLDAISCRVVEIGAHRFVPADPDSEKGTLESLVNPGIPIPAIVSSIHGIHDADVADSPSFAELASKFLELAEGAIIVAHNAPFDMSFIMMELTAAGLPALQNTVIDTLALSRRAFPGLPSYSLGRLASALGIAPARLHRALDDARTSEAIYIASARRISCQP